MPKANVGGGRRVNHAPQRMPSNRGRSDGVGTDDDEFTNDDDEGGDDDQGSEDTDGSDMSEECREGEIRAKCGLLIRRNDGKVFSVERQCRRTGAYGAVLFARETVHRGALSTMASRANRLPSIPTSRQQQQQELLEKSAADHLTGPVVAIKVFHAHAKTDMVLKEIATMRTFRDAAHLVFTSDNQCTTFTQDDQSWRCLFMPAMRMSLATFTDKVMTQPFTDASLGCVVGGVFAGLEEMHAVRAMHLDLKPDNVLVDYTDGTLEVTRVRLCDFGAVEAVGNVSPKFTGNSCTAGYSSPEALLGCVALLSPATDVYSFGALYYEVLTLQPLYALATGVSDKGDTLLALLAAAADVDPSFRGFPKEATSIPRNRKALFTAAGELWGGVSRQVQKSPFLSMFLSAHDVRLIQQCAAVDPHRRPTMALVRKHLQTYGSGRKNVKCIPSNGCESVVPFGRVHDGASADAAAADIGGPTGGGGVVGGDVGGGFL